MNKGIHKNHRRWPAQGRVPRHARPSLRWTGEATSYIDHGGSCVPSFVGNINPFIRLRPHAQLPTGKLISHHIGFGSTADGAREASWPR